LQAPGNFALELGGSLPNLALPRQRRQFAKIGDAESQKKNGAESQKPDPNAASLVAMFKLALGDAVKDVRLSERLTDSPVCLVADEGDLDIHLERMLRAHRQLDQLSKRILEVNPRHPLVARLASHIGKDGASAVISDVAWVLLDQARIIEGETLPDPAAFSRRLSSLLEKGLG